MRTDPVHARLARLARIEAYWQRLRPQLKALIAEGLRIPAIIQRLSAEGITSISGRPLNPATLNRALRRLGIPVPGARGPRGPRKAAVAAPTEGS